MSEIQQTQEIQEISSKDNEPHHLPIVRMNIAALDPPASGKGIRLAIYQGQGLVGDRSAIAHNLANLKKWAKSAATHKAQILLLPELFLCGYNLLHEDVPNVVLTMEQVVDMIAPIARDYNLAIVCPYAEVALVEVGVQHETQHFDAMVLVDQDGTLLRNYRKTHLWGDDEKTNWWFGYTENPSEAYQVNKVNGINVGLLNCYEAEFPELSRILALQGAQLILIPTAADLGTVDAKGDLQQWAYPDVSKTAIPGNAYQNKVFCAYSNHALWEFRPDGKTLSGVYLGNSAIADPYGQVMASADNVETMLVADCIPGDYQATHPDGQSDYIRDRRPDLYGQLTSMEAKFPNGEAFSYPPNPNKYWHSK